MSETIFNLSYVQKENFIHHIQEISYIIHKLNKTWWENPITGQHLERNIGEMLMLVTSELSEALEGHRKNLMDDKLTQYKMYDVEIADALIRLFDIAGAMIPDIGYILVNKLEFNA